MISRLILLALGLVVAAVAAFAMVLPFWYLASDHRSVFNGLVAALLITAIALSLLGRLGRWWGGRRKGAAKLP